MLTIRDVHVFLQSFETLKYALARSRLNYLDLSEVPVCYMHKSVRTLLEQANKYLDKAFYYHALMNKICLATQWNQDGVLESIPTDPFSEDAKMCTEGFVEVRSNLQHICAHVRTLPSDVRKPGFEKIDPMEIFDIEQWKLILNAVYIMGARAEAIMAVNAVMTDILELATTLLTIMANVEVDHEKIVFNGPGACKNPELYPEITVTFQNEQVFYSEEEIERLRREEAERLEREEKEQRVKALMEEIGEFRKILHQALRNRALWDDREEGYINKLFPLANSLLDPDNHVITEDDAIFLKTFKRMLGNDDDGLVDSLHTFFHVFSAHEGGAGYSISRDWMTEKELNSMVKFYLDKGFSVTAMQTMTELDGTLALTALHAKEVIVVTA